MSTNWLALSHELYAEVNGEEIDVVQFNCNYGLNQIPRGSVVFPLGREINSRKHSPIVNIISDAQQRVPIKIFVEITHRGGMSNNKAIVPEGKRLLFEGYITNVSYAQTHGQMSLAAGVTHWLSDLAAASALSASSHPANPFQLTFNAAIPGKFDAPAAGADVSGHWTNKTLFQTRFTREDVEQDLWGKVILPWFKDLASSDRMLLDPELFGEAAKNDDTDKSALNALNRFAGDKLPFDTADLISGETATVTEAIFDDISVSIEDVTGNSNHYIALAGTTLWDKLVGDLASRYMFSLVPFPEKALIVPYIPGLREYHLPRPDDFTIMARDHMMINTPSVLTKPLRAVGLLSAANNKSGAALGGGEPPPKTLINGIYIGRDDGIVLFRREPRYLNKTGIMWVASVAAAGIGAVRADAFNPKAGDKPENDLAKARKDFKLYADRLAHAIFVHESLRGRVGSVVGPVRFDICPGSTIAIEGNSTWNLPDDAALGEARIAQVLQVIYLLDAQAGQASTEYRLSHVRTEAENDNNDTSIERHPLYDRVWVGDKHVVET